MPAVGNALFQHQFHQLLSGRGHIFEALSKGNDREAHALKVLHHLHSAPAVKGDLPDIEAFPKALDELLDVAVVNDIAFCGLEVSLPHTSYGTWSRRTRSSRLSSGIQKYGRMMYLSSSSSGGNTKTNAVISVVEDKSRPP